MIDFSQPITGQNTLIEFYQWALPELSETKAPGTIRDYQSFFSHWRRITGDPKLCDVTRDDLYLFRSRLLEESWTDDAGRTHPPVSPMTVHKHHGYFRFFFSKAVDLGLVPQVPQLYVFRKSVLSPEQARVRAKSARDIITGEETVRLFHGCASARYPFRHRGRKLTGLQRTTLWRGVFYFAWLYGLRKSDLASLCWDCFDFSPQPNSPHGMVLFAPWKLRRKGRLQGLPLTELTRCVLRVLEPLAWPHARRKSNSLNARTGPLFPFLQTKPGSWNTPTDVSKRKNRQPYWVEGWSAAMQRDICATQGILPTVGPDWMIAEVKSREDCVPAITLQVFRQTAVTQYNDYRSDTGRRLGRFIAGHTGGAVDEQSYDKPTQAVWEAVSARERDLLPAIWRTWFIAQAAALDSPPAADPPPVG